MSRFLGIKSIIHYCIVLTITAVTFISIPGWAGYSAFSGVHELYIPSLLQEHNSELFQNDFSTTYNQNDLTLQDEVILFVMDITGLSLPFLLLLLQFIFRFIFCLGLFSILETLGVPTLFRYYAILGTVPVVTFFIEFIPAVVGLSLFVYAVSTTLKSQYARAATLIGITFPIHGITAIPAFVWFFLYLALSWKTKRVTLKEILIYSSIPLLILLLTHGGVHSQNIFETIDPEWADIVAMNASLFINILTVLFSPITHWSYALPLAVKGVIILSSLFALRKYLSLPATLFVYTSALTPLLLSTFQYVLVTLLHLSFFASLQFTRSFFIWDILIGVLLAVYISRRMTRHPHRYISNGILLSTLIGSITTFSVLTFGVYMCILTPLFLFILFADYTNTYTLSERQIALVSIAGIFAIITPLCVLKGHTDILYITISLFLFGVLASYFYEKKAFLISVLVLILFGGYLYSPPEPNPHMTTSQSELCNFIHTYTDAEAIFMTQPFTHETPDTVRMYCLRDVFVLRTDGDQSIFNRNFARAWAERIHYADRLYAEYMHGEQRMEKRFRINYIVSTTKLPENFIPLYENREYFLYAI